MMYNTTITDPQVLHRVLLDSIAMISLGLAVLQCALKAVLLSVSAYGWECISRGPRYAYLGAVVLAQLWIAGWLAYTPWMYGVAATWSTLGAMWATAPLAAVFWWAGLVALPEGVVRVLVMTRRRPLGATTGVTVLALWREALSDRRRASDFDLPPRAAGSQQDGSGH